MRRTGAHSSVQRRWGEPPDHAALRAKHLAFIRKLVSEKKLRLAGPFADEGKLFGISIVDASSAEDARALVEQDPLPNLESLRVRY